MAAGAQTLGPAPGESTPGTASDLVGPTEQSAPTDQESQNRAFTSQIRSLHSNLDDLARQYPDMAEGCRKAKGALQDAMVRHLSQQARSSGGGSAAPPIA